MVIVGNKECYKKLLRNQDNRQLRQESHHCAYPVLETLALLLIPGR